MKKLLVAAALIALASPAQAEIYRHRASYSGGIECSTTLFTYGRSSRSTSECTTPLDRAIKSKIRAEKDAKRHSAYLAVAKQIGQPAACSVYAYEKAKADLVRILGVDLAARAYPGGPAEESVYSENFSCEFAFVSEGRPPSDYAQFIGQENR
jgi:hypothetical protein